MGEESPTFLSQTDAIMWTVEGDPLLRSTILGVVVLVEAPVWDDVVARMRYVIEQVPALRSRVVRAPLHVGTLEWAPVDDVDLSFHLKRVRLPDDGGMPALLELARAEAARAFDRERPLWEFTLVEGLEDGRAAFVMKSHHVVSDGIGAVQLAAHLFDFESPPEGGRRDAAIVDGRPRAPEITGADDHDDGEHGGWDTFQRWRVAVERDVAFVASVARSQLHDAVPNLLRLLRDPVGTVAEMTETARSVGRVVAPVFDTKSPVMTRRTLNASFHTFEIPLDPLRRASRRAGGTLNDGFLAGITGGLRRYHELHGATVDELRMAMPMSLRNDGHEIGGNHITVLRFTVPIEIPDPAERIQALHELGQRLKSERSLAHTEAIAGALNLLPATLLGTMLKHVDFLASNVPGMPVPMYLAGVEVERFFPFGPTAGSSVNLTLMSYCGVCCIGINRDTGAIPDGDAFLRCLSDGFDEVLALADP